MIINLDGEPRYEKNAFDLVRAENEVWEPTLLEWVAETQTNITVGSLTVSGVAVANWPFLVTVQYDSLTLGYDGSNNLTSVVYKKSGVTVATLTLGYDGSGNLASVVKS